MNEVKIPIQEAAQKISVRIVLTGERAFKVRLWMALPLMKLAAWIGGFKDVQAGFADE